MDTTQQSRLTKAEWDSVEVPVLDSEKRVLDLIIAGYHDVNIKQNNNKSLLSYAKIEKSDMIETFFYKNFFQSMALRISHPRLAMVFTTDSI